MQCVRVISKQTMARSDTSYPPPVRDYTAEEIRTLREREAVCQDIFAHYINVSTGTFSKREQGRKLPAGTSLKMLNLVDPKWLAGIL